MEVHFFITLLITTCVSAASCVFLVFRSIDQEENLELIKRRLFSQLNSTNVFCERMQTVEEIQDEIRKLSLSVSKLHENAVPPSRPNNWDSVKTSFAAKPMKVASDE